VNTSVPDIVAAAVFIAALIFSPQAAAIVGPYVVIIGSAVVGAGFAVSRRPRTSRTAAVFYFARVVGLAAILTVLVARLAADYLPPSIGERFLLAPVAWFIGFLGDDAPEILAKISKFFLRGRIAEPPP